MVMTSTLNGRDMVVAWSWHGQVFRTCGHCHDIAKHGRGMVIRYGHEYHEWSRNRHGIVKTSWWLCDNIVRTPRRHCHGMVMRSSSHRHDMVIVKTWPWNGRVRSRHGYKVSSWHGRHHDTAVTARHGYDITVNNGNDIVIASPRHRDGNIKASWGHNAVKTWSCHGRASSYHGQVFVMKWSSSWHGHHDYLVVRSLHGHNITLMIGCDIDKTW